MRHARAFRGPGRSTIEFCNVIGVRFPGSAIKGGKFILADVISGNGGWQEGAVSAAWTQVKQLHETVMTTRRTSA